MEDSNLKLARAETRAQQLHTFESSKYVSVFMDRDGVEGHKLAK